VWFAVLAIISLVLFLVKPKIVFLEQFFFKVEASLATFRQSLMSRPTIIIDRQREQALDQSELASCREENQAMQKLLESPARLPKPLVSARVFLQGTKLAINLGRRDGLVIGQPILAEGFLIGQVSDVGEGVASARLLDDSQSELLVRLYRDDHFLLTTRIKALVLDRLKQDEEVKVGDLIFSAGEDRWPSDLLLGRVSEVMPKEAKLFHQAKVKPLLDYRALTTVFIGL
jgi:rod shape-determining protein MreC